jgi:hypothetical protein
LISEPLGAGGAFISSTERTIVVGKDIRGVLDATREAAAGTVAAGAARLDRERAFPAENLRARSPTRARSVS